MGYSTRALQPNPVCNVVHSTQYTAQWPGPGALGCSKSRASSSLSHSDSHSSETRSQPRPLIGQWSTTRALIGPHPGRPLIGQCRGDSDLWLAAECWWTKTAPPGSHWPRCPRDWTLHNPGTLTWSPDPHCRDEPLQRVNNDSQRFSRVK